MGTIDPKLNDYTWENLTSLKSVFAKKTYVILSRLKEKKDRESFDDTLEVVIEVDSGLLKKLEDEFESIDKMTTKEMAKALKISPYESFIDKKRYINRALELVNSSQKKDEVYAELLTNLSYFYYLIAGYDKALSLDDKSLTIKEEILGKKHPDTASSYNNLAKIHEMQGNYVKAMPLYKKALAIRENVFGIEHPDTASSYNNLAGVYQSQGNYTQALSLYQKALSIREKSLGKEHPDTVTSYNSLAGFYQFQGNYTQALSLYQKALSIREKSLGKEHPDTATSYDNLANCYHSQGDNTQSLQLHQKALAIRKQVFGKAHLYTASSYNNLANYYQSQNDNTQALTLYQKALAIYVEKSNSKKHPNTAVIYSNQAHIYKSQDDDEQALRLYKKALSIREEIFGTEHFQTADSYHELAVFYHSQVDYVQALQLYQKSLIIHEKNVGEKHPYTVKLHKNLDFLKQAQNKLFFLNSNNSSLIFKIDSIKIEYFKQYQDFFINFSPSINIIIGQNAIGKTTLLQAITLGILKENSPDEEKEYIKYIRKDAEKSILTLSHNKDHKKTVQILKEKREIESNYFIPFLLSYGSNFFTKYSISADKIVEDILNETVNKNFSQSIFLDYIDEFWNPLTILRELVRSKHEKAKEKKDLIFNTINSFLELENYKLEEKSEKFFFLKEGDDTELFLEDLSEGYRGNVLLITDMLVKILGVGWTPATIEGIILIDEFDKHLHPKWQSQLVAKLADTFPNIQFIMTTHNPMSILDREPDEITIIKEKDGEIIAVRGNGTKTIDISTVLLEYFGVKSTISESMQQKINIFNRLKLQKELTTEEKTELLEVEDFLGNTVASNFIYDRKYLKFLEYIQVHKEIDFDKYEKIDDEEMDELLEGFGDFFND